MNALEVRRREQDDVVERMRVEETKAALTSARKGMEKEARRLKQEEEDKKKKAENPSSAPAAANGRGSSIGMGGGKWVAPHLRRHWCGEPQSARAGNNQYRNGIHKRKYQ